MGLEIFRAPPEIFLTSPNQTDASTTPTDIDVDLRLREHSRVKLQTGTDVGNGEGSAYGSLLWRNIFGGAEPEGSASCGPQLGIAGSSGHQAQAVVDAVVQQRDAGRGWLSSNKVIILGTLVFVYVLVARLLTEF